MATARQTRRVAILGTFDVENYGDLLFPLVAQACLAESGIEVVAVSPTSELTRYRDAIRPISFKEMTATIESFDAVLIGGGNIVHLHDFGLPTYAASAYPSLWVGATAHAVLHGKAVLWNAPGVLAPRDPGEPPAWLRRVVEAADHFMVRDEASARALARWSGRRPEVLPDTALDLPRLWSPATLAARFGTVKKSLGVAAQTPVVAVHVKRRSLGALDVARFAAALDAALGQAGAVGILLALGRCHGDHELVQELHGLIPDRTAPFDGAEALGDVAAVIAGAQAHIGASLHGHITAVAYGTPARLVAVPALHKFMGQAEQTSRQDELASDWTAALADLPALVTAPRRSLDPAVGTRLQAHWQAVSALAKAEQPRQKRAAVFDDPDPDTALEKVLRVS
ncbi:polysaccharide pyruvyl transferase family protein [Pararhodobacter zhoushanensis]|uniref:polysaccharide pyruvyl transferase family protein n=1 Tax=Pararhodobacter zhoushanensis TaxID=2479545 RepID=UPI000F8F1C60|nr:polysaccharide pyruvyl transferase family protein [Pararhodobacter zhoushanensis]